MKKCLFIVAALTLAAMAWFGSAQAKTVNSTMVKSDTLALYGADSTDVINVENAARMWLTIEVVPPPRDTTGTPYAQKLDSIYALTPVRLAVQARERLTSAAGTDSVGPRPASTLSQLLSRQYVQAAAGNADSTERANVLLTTAANTVATYSDTTVVAWLPAGYRAAANAAAAAAVDTVSIGNIAIGNATVGSTEFDVVIPLKSGVWANARTRRLDLYDRAAGMPFSAHFADFRIRLITGPAVIRYRLILHKEVW